MRSFTTIRPLEEDLDELGLDESHFRRTPLKTKTQKTTAGQRRKWKLRKRRPKAKTQARKRLRKPLVKRRAKMREKFKARRRIPKRRPGRGGRIVYRMYTGMDRISNLVEEVADLVGSLDQASQTEIIRAFAESAVVAEMLGERFLLMAHAINEDAESEEDNEISKELVDLSEAFDRIAEDAAESAEVLFEMAQEGSLSENLDESAVEENFKEIMTAILEGLEIYSDLTEDDDDPLGEVHDKEGKLSAAKRSTGRSAEDTTDQMGVPKAGRFPPRGPGTPRVNQT